MDFDGDDILDFISGSYDPGDIYLFRGLGRGEYAKVQKILDKSGLPLVHHPKQLAEYEKLKNDPDADDNTSIRARVASFGSWVAPVDWENDGDLDLLIGSFSGQLFRRTNEGTRTQPEFGVESIQVHADGKPVQVSGHAAPVIADWNEDGKWDLILGASDGSVSWYENLGTPTEPQFGARQILVQAKADQKFLTQYLAADETPSPGVRAQICVTDYNRDGRLDLILGDYSEIVRLHKLDSEEQAALNALIETEKQLIEKFQNDPNISKDKKAYEALNQEFETLTKKKERFISTRGTSSFVWLYLRDAK